VTGLKQMVLFRHSEFPPPVVESTSNELMMVFRINFL
jgi:hypothetical protein